jgi:amino acid transporter
MSDAHARDVGDSIVQAGRERSDGHEITGARHRHSTERDGVVAQSLLKRWLIGPPLATAQLAHERITKFKGLAVFSSDALSSTAYATEEILLVLVAGGAVALSLSLPVAASIALVLAIVATSYYQTIHAYPSGGGAYIVAHDNLGLWPGLVAAAALLIDYVLTVAVSISAGVAAVTSAISALLPLRVPLALAAILIVMVTNLRGVRESATIFALPTYLFVFSMIGLIAVGFWRAASGLPPVPPSSAPPAEALAPLSAMLLLRAFASGSTAMTGVEAISNGIPAFQPPESRNAGITLIWMAVILGSVFLAITVLANAFGILPSGRETVVSQIARHVFGTGAAYYGIQAATALILILAANTSFADFPRLSSILARDGFLPRQLSNLGDRLVFANGILALAVLAGALVVAFDADTHSLIPLYAVGVFLSFTLSQTGMVMRWWRGRERGWQRGLVVNAVGAAATGVVLGVVIVAKFTHGAWVVLVLIPAYVWVMYRIHSHYQEVRRELSLEGMTTPAAIKHHKVVVPVGGIHRGVVAALRYAKSLSDDVTAVMVEINPRDTEETRRKWERWGMGVPLAVLTSPYRSMMLPMLRYLDALEMETGFDEPITLVVPEFVPAKLWHYLLHGQTALMLKVALLFRRTGNRTVVVTNVPYYFRSAQSTVQDDRLHVAEPRRVGGLGVLFAGLILTTGGLVAAIIGGWPPIFTQIFGLGAIGIIAALFFALLLRSIVR